MTALLLSLALTATSPTWTGALGFIPDAVFGAGQRVELPQRGLSFVIPEGWGGAVPGGATSVVLGSVEDSGLILVFPETDVTVGGARTWMSKMQLVEGLQLNPLGAAAIDGARVSGRFVVTDGRQELAAAAAARMDDSGLALFAVAIGPADQAAEQQAWVVAIVDSAQVDGLPLPPPQPAVLLWP